MSYMPHLKFLFVCLCGSADIDECTASPAACGPNTKECTNAPGSYSCACETGYEVLAGKDIKTDGCTGELHVAVLECCPATS